MMKRYGKATWRSTVCGVVSAALAFALVGATPLAFAEEEVSEEGVDMPEEDLDTPEEGADEPIESAFELGDVTISCVAQGGSAVGSTLAVGQTAEQTYLVTNEGEPAYVRLASSLVCGDLEQPNELGVTDTVMERPGAEDAEEDDAGTAEAVPAADEGAEADEDGPADEGGDEPVVPAWQLAEDGWWYRNVPLASGEVIEVHVVVQIPFVDAWVRALSTGAPSLIEETMSMGAVQARNMTIDLEAERPWGSLGVDEPEEEGPDADETETDGTEDEEADAA